MRVLTNLRNSLSLLTAATAACLVVISLVQQPTFAQPTITAPLATAPQAAPAQTTPAASPTSEKVFRVSSATKRIAITERFSRVIELQNKIMRVDGFDPEVISVSALSMFQLRVQARAPGVTTIVLTDEFEKTYSLEVFVEGDVRHLQAYIDRLFPGSAVKAVKVPDGVVLRGWVSDPNHVSEIVDIASRFFPAPNVLNQMKLSGVNQVKMKVKIMEVQRSRIRKMGFNWLWYGSNGYAASTPGSLAPIASATLPFGGPASVAASAAGLTNSTVNFGLASSNSVFQGFLEALKEEGLLKILAEPQVTTTSGRPASLLAGGEIPILVPQGVGTVSIEWREFGTRLEVVPIVLGGGNLRLEVAPEVSDRDFSNSVTVGGVTVPGLTVRRINTQVEMKFGQTLIIGGLIANRYTAETQKTPLLGELPWVGAAFRKVKYSETETELLILVTPELVAPLNANQVPPIGPGELTDIPTDKELYWQGLIEVPKHAGGYSQGEFYSGRKNRRGRNQYCLPGMNGANCATLPGMPFAPAAPNSIAPQQAVPNPTFGVPPITAPTTTTSPELGAPITPPGVSPPPMLPPQSTPLESNPFAPSGLIPPGGVPNNTIPNSNVPGNVPSGIIPPDPTTQPTPTTQRPFPTEGQSNSVTQQTSLRTRLYSRFLNRNPQPVQPVQYTQPVRQRPTQATQNQFQRTRPIQGVPIRSAIYSSPVSSPVPNNQTNQTTRTTFNRAVTPQQQQVAPTNQYQNQNGSIYR